MTSHKKEKRNFEKTDLILMNLIWNVDIKQSEENEAAVKITLNLQHNNSLYNDVRCVSRTLSQILDGEFGKNSQRRKSVNYFLETLYLRCLIGFLIRFFRLKSISFTYFQYFNPAHLDSKEIGRPPRSETFLETWQSIYDGLFAEIVNGKKCSGTNIRIQNLSSVYLHKPAILAAYVFKKNNNQFLGGKLLLSDI